jgi:histidine triad (HIT) family protein
MPSIFSKIVSNDIPAYKIAENEHHLAFLDIFPLAKGHVLLVPKKEIDYLFDITSDEYLELWKFAQKVAKGMDKVITCERIGVAVIGLEVPHAHIHLVPLNNVSDINFERPKLQFSKAEMKSVADLIKSAI